LGGGEYDGAMNRNSSPKDFLDSREFTRVARAISYLGEHWLEQPSLAQVAAQVGLSVFHFNRLFRRWAGITPKRYLEVLTGRAALRALDAEPTVLDAAHAVGLSGPGRLHDLMVTLEAASPGELRAGGAGLTVRYGSSDSPFGRLLVAESQRGICQLVFADSVSDERAALVQLTKRWPNAKLNRDNARAAQLARAIFAASGDQSDPAPALRLQVTGSNFQIKVWQALLDLGRTELTTYASIATALGKPSAARPTGNAVGANPIAWLIPCHHVLRADGTIGGYRWGVQRKRAMLAWETVRGHSAV
jgi:AraC family transcriptional regulator, regulatory protein of adaptative response / methylated-DNA-[protein]-cysteine methyltransferase